MIFELDKTQKKLLKQIKSITLHSINWTEKDLEELISENISLFIPDNQLMVIAQERQGKEEADILALDQDGDLYIFELKRWQSNQENILQVLRYGQIFGQYDLLSLQNMARKYFKNQTLDLASAHQKYFSDIRATPLAANEFNVEQHFVVVTNGVDMPTINAIQYWRKKGLNIDYYPYKVYEINNAPYIEFRTYNPENEILIELDTNIFIVNTNLTWSDTNYREMLQENKAAAYGNKRFAINRIKANDIVLLYHKRAGIIAYGKAIGTVNKNEDDEAYSIAIKYDWKIDPDESPQKAVAAWEINQAYGSQYTFRNTVFQIDEAMFKIIRDIAATK